MKEDAKWEWMPKGQRVGMKIGETSRKGREGRTWKEGMSVGKKEGRKEGKTKADEGRRT